MRHYDGAATTGTITTTPTRNSTETADSAAAYAAQAASLRTAMETYMWNASGGYYCDGICDDPVIAGFGGP